MPNTAEFKITDLGITKDIEVGNISKTEDKDLASFFQELSAGAHFDSGILPLDGTGVLAIRKAFDHTQIVFQHKPDTYMIIWGAHEHDKTAATIKVAQPYRVVIGDLEGGQLLGARHFYSPVPLQTGDQVLYHVNLPNLNCKGYHATSVGWMCLYHKSDWSKLSFDHKIRALIERAGGGEAYNDGNMHNTDGPRFYTEQYKKKHPNDYNKYDYLWNPQKWQAKTEKDGVDWVLDSDLWIPVKVEGVDSQKKHVENGKPLTLEMAMLGGYHAYYTDKTQPKPFNAYARSDLKNPDKKVVFTYIGKAFTSAKKKEVAPQPPSGIQVKKWLGQQQNSTAETTTPEPIVEAPQFGAVSFGLSAPVNPIIFYCPDCNQGVHQEDSYVTLPQGTKVCTSCATINYAKCDQCTALTHFNKLQAYNDKKYCTNCHIVSACPNCGSQFLDDTTLLIGVVGCVGCTKYEYCQSCDSKGLEHEIKTIKAKDPVNPTAMIDFKLCLNCLGGHVICDCGFLRVQGDCGAMGDGTFACGPCISYKPDGMPFYEPAAVSITS